MWPPFIIVKNFHVKLVAMATNRTNFKDLPGLDHTYWYVASSLEAQPGLF